MKSVNRLIAVITLSVTMLSGYAQPEKKETKPYKVLTSGKQITIKSTRNIKHVMIWTTGGDRVAEHRDVHDNTLTIDMPISRKTFFLMVGLENGKIYTEKIGLQ